MGKGSAKRPAKKTAAKAKAKPAKKSAAKTAKKTTSQSAKKAVMTAKPSSKPAKKMQTTSARPEMKTAKPSVQRATINWNQLISPLEDRLVIEPQALMEKTTGGLYIPATVNEKPLQGKVLAKGRGRRNRKGQVRPLDVNVGDEIMFAQYAGTPAEIAGQEVLILREEEVLGIVTQ
jgi:chaperonin GroES